MTRQHHAQTSLFDEKQPRLAQQPKQKAELAAAVNALLREIAAALAKPAKPEAGHEQDHG